MNPTPRRADGWSLATVAWLILGVIGVVLGLYARFDGLGTRPLAVDEYYLLQAVSSILEDGLPSFPGGGYYGRGILVQYLTAPFLYFLDDPHLALRLPATFFGLASVVLAYTLARKFVQPTTAAAFALLVLLSSWEVEFSRFGRMYAGFQFFTLLFLVTLDGSWEARGIRRYAPHLAVTGAVLCHSLGIFLTPLLFLPELLRSPEQRAHHNRGSFVYLAASGVLSAVLFWYIRFDFRDLGVSQLFPADYDRPVRSLLRLPSFAFVDPGLGADTILQIAIGVTVLGTLALGVQRLRGRAISGAHVLALASVVFAIVHQLVVVLPCLALLALRYREVLSPGLRKVAIASAVISGGWIFWAGVVSVTEPSWYVAVDAGSILGGIRRALFGWPDLYVPVFVEWQASLPRIGLLAVGSWLVIAPGVLRQGSARDLAIHPVALVPFLLIPLASFTSPVETPRYTYFFFPLILLLPFLALDDLSRRGRSFWPRGIPTGPMRGRMVAVLAFLLVLPTEDLSIQHLLSVDEPAASYRMGPYEGMEHVWYYRRDYRSPAEFVDRQRPGPEDLVVASQVPSASWYLNTEHVIFYSRDSRNFQAISRDQGRTDLWTGRPLLSTDEGLRMATKDMRRVWIVFRYIADPIDPERVWGDRLRSDEVVFEGEDGRIGVRLVQLRP